MSFLPKLEIYKEAYAVALEIYSLTATFPLTEQFGITSQLRRAGYSIAANISEGYRKRTAKEKLHFYTIAICSVEECIFFINLATDLGYLKQNSLPEKLDHLAKRIYSYCKALKVNPKDY